MSASLPQAETAAGPGFEIRRALLLTRDVLGMTRASAAGLPPGPAAEALGRAAHRLSQALGELEAAPRG